MIKNHDIIEQHRHFAWRESRDARFEKKTPGLTGGERAAFSGEQFMMRDSESAIASARVVVESIAKRLASSAGPLGLQSREQHVYNAALKLLGVEIEAELEQLGQEPQ